MFFMLASAGYLLGLGSTILLKRVEAQEMAAAGAPPCPPHLTQTAAHADARQAPAAAALSPSRRCRDTQPAAPRWRRSSRLR